jgi:hypothetical protein
MSIGLITPGSPSHDMTPGGAIAAASNNAGQGVNFTTNVWGSTIPISGGYRMITGVPIWAGPPITQNVRTQIDPLPPGFDTGAPHPTYTSWEIARSFAVGLGFRLSPNAKPTVRRVWADGTLVWSNNGDSQPLNFGGLIQDYLPQGIWVDGVWVPNGPNDGGGPSHGFPPGSNGSGNTLGPQNPLASNLTFRFYQGTEEQVPDTAIAAALGDLAPAFRGLMYMVIDGLVIGKGFSQSSNQVSLNNVSAVPGYPVINVELTDASETVVRVADVQMLPGAVPLHGPVLTNWDSREAVMITRVDDGGGWLETFDLDSAVQTSHIAITGMSDPTTGVGPDEGFAVWDKLNNIIYSYTTNRHGGAEPIFVSLGRDGVIISKSVENGVAPSNVDGSGDPTHWTTLKPAISFPKCFQGDLTYLVQAGQLQPVFFAGNQNWCVAVTPNDGILPAGFEGISVFQSGQTISNIIAYPTYPDALTNRTQYQDTAFLFTQSQSGIATDPPECHIVFVSNVRRGQTSVANILGSQLVHTGANLHCVLRVMLDSGGNILIQERDSVTGTIVVYRYNCAMTNFPDFAVAPGWQGRFPQVGSLAVDAKVTGEDGNPWNGLAIVNSDLSQGTFSGGGHVILNINDLSVTDPGFTHPVGNNTTAWDSVTKTRWFTENQASGFTNGLRFIQAIDGLNGDVSTVGEWVKEIALYVGTQSANISVDASLSAKVPGVAITHPYQLDTLYNDIGVLYDFSYFSSGGRMRFVSASNNPIKATGTWTITATGLTGGLSNNIAEGATLTIGSFTYRFKAIPVAPFDVKISLDTSTTQLDACEKTCQNLYAALSANLAVAAADSQDPLSSPGFFAGTVKNSLVTGKLGSTTSAFGTKSILLTAVLGGAAGNAIVLSNTGAGHNVSSAHLSNGAEPPEPSVTITKDQLAYAEEDQIAEFDALITTIAPSGQSQNAAAVTYFAIEQNYILATQTFTPDNQGGSQLVGTSLPITYDLPFVISTSDAYARVAQTAFKQADNEVVQNFRLPQAFMLLEPSDIVAVHIAPYSYLLRLDEATLNGDYSTSFSAVNYSYRTDISVADSDATGTLPQTVATASDAMPLVMDIPTLDARQTTVVGSFDLLDGVRAYRSPFSLAALSSGKVVAGAANQVSLWSTSLDVKWGNAAMPTAIEPYYRTVEDSISVSCKTLRTSDFASADSYQSFVAGQNCIAVGTDQTGWELIYFRDVTVVNDKLVKLTGLIRAQRGTDAFVSHGPSDIVVLVSSASDTFTSVLRPQSVTSDQASATFRYSSLGQPNQRGPVSEDVPVHGYQLYPFSPCRLKAAAGGSNSVVLSWLRRDRGNAEYVTHPATMSEASELYDLEILNGSTVVRTVNGLTTPTYTYIAADQTTDGFTPPLAALKVQVYQRGELGRGFPRQETLNVS